MGEVLDMSTLSLEESEHLAISDVKLVTSYSWLNSASPTIAVPGMPAKWLDRDDTPLIKPDSHLRCLDFNGMGCPESPFEPGLRAVLQTEPNFDFTSLQLITDRYALWKLLDYAGNQGQWFQFGAQVVGDTVVFVRDDPAVPKLVTRFMGFKEDFGEKYLQHDEGFENKLAHYRIITYRIGDLKIMLRYAADAYLPDWNDNFEDSVSDDTVVGHEGETGELTIEKAGTLVPHHAVVELYTCSRKSTFLRLERPFRAAWLCQAQHFALAQATDTKHVKDMDEDFRDRRVVFFPEDILFYGKPAIMEMAGVDDQRLVRVFYQTLKDLVRLIREAAANGRGSQFLITHAKDADDLEVNPSEAIPVLSGELCERLKTAAAVRGVDRDDEAGQVDL